MNRNSSFAVIPPAIYTLDHLATFTVSHKQRMLTPQDGMHQLRHMETTTGIWTMRIEMRIDPKEIVITETATQKEIESFPISFITNPVHIQTDNKKDVYNNIVIFTVQSDAAGRTPPEMNVFQCIGVSGKEVVEDITAARNGKFPRPKRPPVKEKPRLVEPPPARIFEEQPVVVPVRVVENQTAPAPTSARNSYDERTRPKSDISAQQVEETETEVIQLNRCFDDIERFVASLQHAANANKELEKRQAAGASQSELDILRKRTQAPSIKEFVGIFQKFKFALNLLPKLKDVLKDPDVKELTRTLFSPLSLVLESSRDQQGHLKLANSVISPLLTLDTCKLMDQSLGPKDVDLWQSIGNSWVVPSERWTGPGVSPYTPVFDEGGRVTNGDGSSAGQSGQSSLINGSATNGKSASGQLDSQQKYLNDLRARNCKICQVQATRENLNTKELAIVIGEYLEVVSDEKNWWRVTNNRGETGYAPKTILKQMY
jgi:epidermal growth factor receptor kinase substrate 8